MREISPVHFTVKTHWMHFFFLCSEYSSSTPRLALFSIWTLSTTSAQQSFWVINSHSWVSTAGINHFTSQNPRFLIKLRLNERCFLAFVCKYQKQRFRHLKLLEIFLRLVSFVFKDPSDSWSKSLCRRFWVQRRSQSLRCLRKVANNREFATTPTHRSLVDSSKFIFLGKFAWINMVFIIIIIIIILPSMHLFLILDLIAILLGIFIIDSDDILYKNSCIYWRKFCSSSPGYFVDDEGMEMKGRDVPARAKLSLRRGEMHADLPSKVDRTHSSLEQAEFPVHLTFDHYATAGQTAYDANITICLGDSTWWEWSRRMIRKKRMIFIESFPQRYFEGKWLQNRLRADKNESRSLLAVDFQGHQRGGFCTVPKRMMK